MNFKNFFDAFPPPDFLNFPYAGISISDTAVRCLQLSKKGKALSVSKFAQEPLPLGAVVSGAIINVGEVANILEKMKKDLNLGYAKVSLPEEKAYLFTTKIPIVENKEVRSAVEFKMEENVPVSPSELIFDYAVSDPYSHTDHLNVVVSALPISVLDKYVETFHTAGIPILSLEIESQAIARAVLLPGDSNTHLIIHFGREKVGLYVASGCIVHFTSTISVKGVGDEAVSFLSQEVKKLYTYWHTLKENAGVESKKIVSIIACGENVGDQILSYLSSHVKTEATPANVWINAFDINADIPQISFEDSLKFAPAVGLALPSENLI